MTHAATHDRDARAGSAENYLPVNDWPVIITAMPQQKTITMSTTDRIPGPEGNREAQRSALTWISGYISLEDAHDAMARWAENNGYDAVIGVRFVAHPDEDYSGTISYGGETNSRLRWTAYGTAIGGHA
jgi:hypothetical protein